MCLRSVHCKRVRRRAKLNARNMVFNTQPRSRCLPPASRCRRTRDEGTRVHTPCLMCAWNVRLRLRRRRSGHPRSTRLHKQRPKPRKLPKPHKRRRRQLLPQPPFPRSRRLWLLLPPSHCLRPRSFHIARWCFHSETRVRPSERAVASLQPCACSSFAWHSWQYAAPSVGCARRKVAEASAAATRSAR